MFICDFKVGSVSPKLRFHQVFAVQVWADRKKGTGVQWTLQVNPLLSLHLLPLMCTIDVIWRVSGRRKGKGEVTGSHLYRTGINIAHSESDQYTRRIESPGPLAEKHEGGKCGIIPSRCSLCTPCNSSLRSLQNPPLFNCLLLIYWICSVSKTNSNSSDFMLI